MYNHIAKIDRVLSFGLLDTKLLIREGTGYKDNQLKLYKKFNDGNYLISENVLDFKFQLNNSSLWLELNGSKETYEYNFETKQSFKVNYYYLLTDNAKSLIVGLKEEQIICIDSVSRNILWKKEEATARIGQSDNSLFYTIKSGTILKSIDKNTGKDLWSIHRDKVVEQISYQFSKKLFFRNILGYWNDSILICLSDYTILQIKNDTGGIDSFWKNDIGLYPAIFNSNCNYFIPEENKIIGLFETEYWEIDLITKKCKIHYLHTDFGFHNLSAIHFGRAVICGDELIFPSEKLTVDEQGETIYNTSIAILDRTTLKIKWVHHFEGPETDYIGFFGQVEADEDRIYVRTNTNKLHIFEKIKPLP